MSLSICVLRDLNKICVHVCVYVYVFLLLLLFLNMSSVRL